jgi:hypothetical protein
LCRGYLGEGTEKGLYDNKNTERIIDINYFKLIPVMNYFAHKFESRRSGTIIGFPQWQETEEDRVILLRKCEAALQHI